MIKYYFSFSGLNACYPHYKVCKNLTGAKIYANHKAKQFSGSSDISISSHKDGLICEWDYEKKIWVDYSKPYSKL